MDANRFQFVVLAAALLCAPACRAANPAQSYPADEVIPLDQTGPRPTAQLRLGDTAPVTAIFDSGAAASVLRLSYAQSAGLPNEGPAAAAAPSGAPSRGFRTTLHDAMLGNARFDNALAVAFDIPLPLPGVDVVISPAVFRGRLVRFDFAASEAHVLARTPENTPPGEGEPYLGGDTHGQINRTPGGTLRLPGMAPLRARLDTGAARGLSLSLSLAEHLPLTGPLQPREPVRRIGVEYRAFTAELNGPMQLGGVTLDHPTLIFIDGDVEPNAGIEVLRNGVLVLDPGNHRSWFLPASS